MGRAREKGETTKMSEICHVNEVMNLIAHLFIGPVSGSNNECCTLPYSDRRSNR